MALSYFRTFLQKTRNITSRSECFSGGFSKQLVEIIKKKLPEASLFDFHSCAVSTARAPGVFLPARIRKSVEKSHHVHWSVGRSSFIDDLEAQVIRGPGLDPTKR